uniref:Tetraspanin n=1 Tax=Corethrella appendiculata TaxID=1370023 RepID=U5EYJ6_9DIPT
MGLSCGMSLIKYILFIFNLLCAICGIALIAIGAVILSKFNELDKLVEEHNAGAPPIALIVLGSIIFIISFFGCCGAIRESYCMSLTYGFFLLVLLIAQIVIAALIFIYIGDVVTAAKNAFDTIWENRSQQQNAEFLDVIQANLHCCGKTTFLEWGVPPLSCCGGNTIVGNVCNPTAIYLSGCRNAVGEFITGASHLLGWIAVGVAVIQFVGLISACCLANSIRNNERRYA